MSLKKNNTFKNPKIERKKEFNLDFSLPKWGGYGHTSSSNSKCFPKMVSLEKFNLTRVKALQEYLQDTVDLYEKGSIHLPVPTFEWYKLNLSRMNNVLEGTQGEFFSSSKHVYHSNSYTQVSKKVPIGRLYATKQFSYQKLPRGIRSFLVEDEYRDYDIVNAHPCLLLEFAKQNLNSSNFPCFESYVSNRDGILEEKALKDGVSLAEAKENLLKVLNTTKDHALSLGFMSEDLYNEVKVIRKGIVELVRDDMQVYALEGDTFLNKSQEKADISMMSLYLQTKETDYIMSIANFLVKKTCDFLEENVETPLSYQDHTVDRNVTIPHWFYYLQLIPFFDGFYLGSECAMHFNRMDNWVLEFNSSLEKEGSLVVFKKKRINQDSPKLNKESLKTHFEIYSFLKGVDTKELNELFVLFEVPNLKFTSTDRSQMELEARDFRRYIYSRLKQELGTVPLNVDFLPAMQVKYKDLAEKHKRALMVRESYYETSNTLEMEDIPVDMYVDDDHET